MRVPSCSLDGGVVAGRCAEEKGRYLVTSCSKRTSVVWREQCLYMNKCWRRSGPIFTPLPLAIWDMAIRTSSTLPTMNMQGYMALTLLLEAIYRELYLDSQLK